MLKSRYFLYYLIILKLFHIHSLKVYNCFLPHFFLLFLGSFSQMESQINLLAVMWVIQWRMQSWCEFMAIRLSCQSIEMRKSRVSEFYRLMAVHHNSTVPSIMDCAMNLYREKHWIQSMSATLLFSGIFLFLNDFSL